MSEYPLVWPVSWDALAWHERRFMLEEIDEAFARLERGEIAQPEHIHVDSCGAKGCGECYPIPTIYVTWEANT